MKPMKPMLSPLNSWLLLAVVFVLGVAFGWSGELPEHKAVAAEAQVEAQAVFEPQSDGTVAEVEPEPEIVLVNWECADGSASWYGPYDPYSGCSFQGKRTANGERYDMMEMTAAHRTLPFNTMVTVQRLDKRTGEPTGVETAVRINDRGPFILVKSKTTGKRRALPHPRRIIDLSKAAAMELDMIKAGTVPVRVCWEVN